MDYKGLSAVAILMVACIVIAEARSVRSIQNQENGNEILEAHDDVTPLSESTIPEAQNNVTSGDDSDWSRCRGMPCEDFDAMMETVKQIYLLQSGLNETDNINEAYPSDFNDTFDGCITLTLDQATRILTQLQQEQAAGRTSANTTHAEVDHTQGPRRRKRKVIDFTREEDEDYKWTEFPIMYRFDSRVNDVEKALIRAGFQEWERQTCVTFNETQQDTDERHIHITNDNDRCTSLVGRHPYKKGQRLNLRDSCIQEFGTIVHEIGHALGLWHEHARPDRDDYIDIDFDKLGYNKAEMLRIDSMATLDIPYDYGSVMHYPPKNADKVFIKAKDDLFQSSMGQRSELAFSDAHYINKVYCQDVCADSSLVCQHGGYPDPKDCSRCRCPPGLAGDLCQQTRQFRSPAPGYISEYRLRTCGGEVNLTTSQNKTIGTPWYRCGHYANNTECAWYFRAPPEHRVQIVFNTSFSVGGNSSVCHHWVELRGLRSGDIGKAGPRFCGTRAPFGGDTAISKGGELLVIFHSMHWPAIMDPSSKGFQAFVTAVTAAATYPDP